MKKNFLFFNFKNFFFYFIKIIRVDWLRHVVVRAILQRFHGSIHGGKRRDDNDGNLLVGAGELDRQIRFCHWHGVSLGCIMIMNNN